MADDPRATYRVQLRPGFGFAEAAEIVGTLAELGISHLYCSPVLQAAPGSTHGYDVVDPTRVNEDLGGAEGFDALVESLHEHGMGLVLDVVPNHMAITAGNPWWWDLLENGRTGRHASTFDVDWGIRNGTDDEKILLPVLGDHYGRVLEAGGLRLQRSAADFVLRYHEHVFPVAPSSLEVLLAPAARRHDRHELAFVADVARWLGEGGPDDPEVRRAHRDVLRDLLRRVLESDSVAAADVDAEIARANADPDRLDVLIEAQHYRLALWRTADQELDFRRFFDIDSLVGLRVEDERVFADLYGLVLRWVDEGRVQGIRVDHPDGLRDPLDHLQRLRAAAPRAWIVVEKILRRDEGLREQWPVDGTTGYDFLDHVTGLLVDPEGVESLRAAYVDFTGEDVDTERAVVESKRKVLRDLFGSDVNLLVDLLRRSCARHRRYRDYTRDRLRRAVIETIAHLPVYRTYVRTVDDGASPEDTRLVEDATAAAKRASPNLDPLLFDFLRDLLLLRRRGPDEDEFALRAQQLSGAAMAKGVEDTAHYAHVPFLAANEVGGNPEAPAVTVDAFHAWARSIRDRWPYTLLATSTHDTKRSEDVRARLVLLSEIADRWTAIAGEWSRHNERHRHGDLVDRVAEWFLYQTLVGAWPIECERIEAYVLKAAREAKRHTTWVRHDESYEAALVDFVHALYDDAWFRRSLEDFVLPLVRPGRINSLVQTLIKLTAPGVPDLYQGTELWNATLVDPDNRRAVDFGRRAELVRTLDDLGVEEVVERMDEGLPKLWTIRRALALRARRPALFGPDGAYAPLVAEGPAAERVVAFARGDGAAVTVVPRRVLDGDDGWEDTALPLGPGRWSNLLTDERFDDERPSLADLWEDFPVALLEREEVPA